MLLTRWTGPLLVTLAALAGCAGQAPSNGTMYRCEHDLRMSVEFRGNAVVLDSRQGYDILYRLEGDGPGPVAHYANTRMSAEFGLGPQGREAVIHYPLLPLVARCVTEEP